MTAKKRLDLLLVERVLAPTREKARALIMAGEVYIDGVRAEKAGQPVDPSRAIEIRGRGLPYVSRGGLKLEAALAEFGVDVRGRTALDVGSSTGGFTDCLLQRGARRVYAVDVGHGQLDHGLRKDARVVVLEGRNMRYLRQEEIPEPVDVAVVDVSFISLKKILPRVREFLGPGGEVVALVKPQFEAGRREVGRGGIVRDPAVRERTVDETAGFAESIGLRVAGRMVSPVPGKEGNTEVFLHCVLAGPSASTAAR